MSTFTIPTIYTAVDKFSPAVKAMERANTSFGAKLDSVSMKSERMFKKLTPGLSDATKQMVSMASSAALVGAAIGTAAFSTKAIMDYENATKSLEAVTGVSFDKFKNDINELSKSSKKSSIDVVKSFEVIGSAMSEYLSDPKGLRMIADAGITLSKASKMELEPTLQALTSVMNQFGLKAEFATDTINRLTAGEIVGSISTATIAEHLQQFGAVASANNVTISESVALVETLGKKLPVEQLGTASRNLISFMSAAKGMPKEARAQLAKHGVSLDILMDKNKSLGVRLRELSKIQKDSVAMVKFFGRENLAAGTAIFQNLDTYDKWAKEITTTNKAQEQAAINSNTLSNKLDELKNRWINMLTSSDKASKGLNVAKKIIGLLTDNLETIITVGVGFLGFMAAWKIANIVLKGAMIASRAVATAFYIYDMVKYVASTQGITMATAAWEIAQSSLNATLAANPIGLVVVAVAALAYAIYNLYKNWDSVSTLFSTGAAGIARDFSGAWLTIQDSFMTMVENIKLGWSGLQMSLGVISAKEHVNNMVRIKAEQTARTKGIIENSMASKAASRAEGRQILTAFVNDAKKNDSDFGTSKMAQVEAGLNATSQKTLINPKAAQSQATANAMTNNVIVNNALPGTTVDINGKKTEAKSTSSLVPSTSSTMK